MVDMRIGVRNSKYGKVIILFFIIVSFYLTLGFISRDLENHLLSTIRVSTYNPLQQSIKDVLITIPIESLVNKYPDFNEKAFIAFDGEKEIPSQVEDLNGDGKTDNILMLVDFTQAEKKIVSIQYDKLAVIKKEFKKRTHAELSIKTDYVLENGVYTKGKFKSVDNSTVPVNHFAHDAWYKYEGPGWESEKVAYRFYLDSRNRNDIFGKKVDDLVLSIVGINDLVSDSKESYTNVCDWGMDIFKVGESLGIGSIAIWENNKVNTISNTETTTCQITNDGLIKSNILTIYKNTKIGKAQFDISSLISISAGSRLTREDLTITDDSQIFCTGIAKHADCSLIKDDKNFEWGFIATYEKQSLAGDNLGLAIFYKKSNLIKNTEDDFSYITVLNPVDGELTYYYAAAWENEKDGISSKEEFIKYLNNTILELSNPITIELL